MKALNVDDKDENLYYLETVLRAADFEVLNAHNGVEALALLSKESVDLIVSDILMPRMDGFQLCHEVHKQPALAGIPFIFYTGTYTDEKDAALAKRLGACRYLIKPIEPSELCTIFREFAVQIQARKQNAQPEPPAAAQTTLEEEARYLKSHNERLAHKLEEKMEDYDALSDRLQSAYSEKVQEVVGRIQMQDNLRLSEERYRAVISALAEGILLADQDGRVVTCNDSAAAILGVEKHVILAAGIDHVILQVCDEHERVFSADAHPLRVCLKQNRSAYYPILGMRRANGARIWISAHVRPCLVSASGQPSLVVMSCTDITAQRIAEQRLVEQAHIIDESHDAIIVCDPDGTIRHWNQGAHRLYGWTAEEAIGLKDRELFVLRVPSSHYPIPQAIAKGTLEGEYTHTTKDGLDLFVHGRFSVVFHADGKPKAVIAFYFDTTEKKALEEKFLRAQRLESIGILAGGVAHDLNNVLAPILLALPIVRMRINDPQGLNLLDTMEASANRGAQIVRQILTFSRGMRTERIALQTRHLLKEIAEIMQETFPRNISIDTSLPRTLWMVEADTTQLHQVIMNLCVNARDAMPNGGTLTLQAENVELNAAAAAHIPESRSGDFVRLSISDTGTGIPRELHRRIFEPFFSTKAPGSGTGLGLSTALSIVKQHGGFIGVVSELDQGTRFDVYLPAIISTDEEPAPAGKNLLRGNGELILVIDDEFALRHIAESLLAAHNYRVITAESGQKGLALLRENPHEIALVITDLLMPGISGAELIPMLKALKPGLKIIAISGNLSGEESTVEEKMPAGIIADGYLGKPFSAEVLLKLVHDVLTEC